MNIAYKNFTSNRKFGVEYEVTANCTKKDLGALLQKFESEQGTTRPIKVEEDVKGWAETHSNDYWHVKYDSTCGPLGKHKDFGWELASYIGSGDADIITISKMAAFLAKSRVETNENCGLHIHADTSDFTREEMGVLLSHWLNLEPILLHSCPSRRKNNKYCKPLSKKFKSILTKNPTPEKLWYTIKPTNYSPHENPQKKVTLNVLGFAMGLDSEYYPRKTIELRLPEGVLDQEYICNWIRLYLNFIEVCKTRTMADISTPCKTLEDALWTLGLEGRESLLLLSPELLEAKIWFLGRLIIHSVNQIKLRQAALKKLALITQL